MKIINGEHGGYNLIFSLKIIGFSFSGKLETYKRRI
jgi:hypothetical protein